MLLHCRSGHPCSNWGTTSLNRHQPQVFSEIKCEGWSLWSSFPFFALFLFQTMSYLHHRGTSVWLSVWSTESSEMLAFLPSPFAWKLWNSKIKVVNGMNWPIKGRSSICEWFQRIPQFEGFPALSPFIWLSLSSPLLKLKCFVHHGILEACFLKRNHFPEPEKPQTRFGSVWWSAEH